MNFDKGIRKFSFTQNSDDEKCSQKASKLASCEVLKLHHIKYQSPTALGLKREKFFRSFSWLKIYKYTKL